MRNSSKAAVNHKAVPLRVDFAGGWLDVPRLAVPGAFVVNCAIRPLVSLNHWEYEKNSGLGGSAAWSILNGKDPFESELAIAGWQDPAVILETGFCVWRSGSLPVLELKRNPEFLEGKMALMWTGSPHRQSTGDSVGFERDYHSIVVAGNMAAQCCFNRDPQLTYLACGIERSYAIQTSEGMTPLPVVKTAKAMKYLGSGWGGYALYLFDDKQARDEFHWTTPKSIPIEPYMRGL